MARIVGSIALSHSPFWDLGLPPEGAPGHAFVRDLQPLRRQVTALSPDVVVAIGPDHFRNFFYDVLPPFCIGVEALRAFGDFGRMAGDLPVAGELARRVHAGVSAGGFDPAISYQMGIDHGIAQAYEVFFPDRQVPLLPIMVNANGAPRPSFARCHDFGVTLGAALRADPDPMRVLLLGSGGMSHSVQPMSADAGLAPELRAYVIGGRHRAQEQSAQRDRRLQERARQGMEGPVNEAWDRHILSLFAAADGQALRTLADADVEAQGGNGAHELRAWLMVQAAWGAPMATAAYEAVPRWVTGMGCIAALDDTTSAAAQPAPTSTRRAT